MSISEYRQNWRDWKKSLERRTKHELITELYASAKQLNGQKKEIEALKAEKEELKEAFFDYLDKTPNTLVNELIINRGCSGDACKYEFGCDYCPIAIKEMMDEDTNT